MAQSGLVNFKADFSSVERYLSRIEREQLPFAKALALTRTAAYVAGTKPYKKRGVLQRYLPRVFDRPTPWTLNAFYITPASKREKRFFSIVHIDDGSAKDIRKTRRGGKIGTPPFKYLKFQAFGGVRDAKGHEKQLRRMGFLDSDEFTVPADPDHPKGKALNKYGNLPGSFYSKVLADIDPQRDYSGIAQGRGQATLTRSKRRYFFYPGRGKDRSAKKRGIYERYGRGGKKVRMVLFIVRNPRYRPRFDFDATVARASRKRLPVEFRRAMALALATARR